MLAPSRDPGKKVESEVSETTGGSGQTLANVPYFTLERSKSPHSQG